MKPLRAALIGAILLTGLNAQAMAPGPKTTEEYSKTSLNGVLDPDRPVIAIDIEGLAGLGKTEEAVAAFHRIISQTPEGYQLFALDSSLRAVREKRPALRLFS